MALDLPIETTMGQFYVFVDRIFGHPTDQCSICRFDARAVPSSSVDFRMVDFGRWLGCGYHSIVFESINGN